MNEPAMSFEASLARLEEIVQQLQKGTVPLADALKLFQEGTALIAGATKLLDEAELKVREFRPEGSGGGDPGEEDDDELPF